MKFVDKPIGTTKDGVSVYRRVLLDPLRKTVDVKIPGVEPPRTALSALNFISAQE